MIEISSEKSFKKMTLFEILWREVEKYSNK